MLRSLLVPLDGSMIGEAVLPWALFFAREKHVPLTLARIVPASTTHDPAIHAESPEPWAWTSAIALDAATIYLKEVCERLAREGAEVDIAVRPGRPARALLNLAEELDVSAIALATHDQDDEPDHPLGVVAEQILQETPVPVLLVPARRGVVDRSPSLRRLLVPLDGSPLAERALDEANDIADEETNLRLVRVVEPIPQTLETAEGRLTFEDTEATSRARSEATTYLARLRASVEGEGHLIEACVALGRPDRQILATAQANAVDLIVMATHGSSGTGRGWLGSVANDVVRRAVVPVFLVSTRALVARLGRAYRVADVMTRDLITVCADEPLDAAIRRLLRRRISGAPVVGADGALVGVITEHDLLRWQLETARAWADQSPAEATIPELLKAVRTSEVMSRLVVSVEESLPLSSAIPILLELPNRRLPVTRHGRPIGIVARADVLKALGEQDLAGLEPALAGASDTT